MPPDNPLRAAVHAALGASPTPAQREALAAELEQIAQSLRAVAEAQRRQQARPASARVAPRKRQAGPGRRPSSFIRIERRMDPAHPNAELEKIWLFVGRALYYALGSPARMDVQRLSGRLVIRPVAGDAGYKIAASGGMPRMTVSGARDLIEDLEDGRYAATIEAGAVVVGMRLE